MRMQMRKGFPARDAGVREEHDMPTDAQVRKQLSLIKQKRLTLKKQKRLTLVKRPKAA